MTAALYQATSEVSRKRVAVDTSKPPVRNYALLLNDSFDTRLIRLMQDGRGAVWSLSKPPRRDVEADIPRDLSTAGLAHESALGVHESRE